MFVLPKQDNAWYLGVKELKRWNAALHRAARALDMDIDDVFRIPSTILFPTIQLHERVGKGRRRISCEALPPRVIITFPLLILENDGSVEHKYPDADQITQLWNFFGRYEGISPHGSEEGFGRFTVESIHSVGRESPHLGELS
jgi:hypothetical protein